MTDVVMLTAYDWANTGWRFYNCLKSLGLDVVFFKGHVHDYNYPIQAPLHTELEQKRWQTHPICVNAKDGEIAELVKGAKVVHFTASTFIDTGIDLSQKHVVVQHGGSTYRKNPVACNNVFNEFVDHTIIQCPDLLGLGAKSEHLIYYPVDTDLLQPDYHMHGGKLIVGHFPSSPEVKGTKKIVEVIDNLYADRKFGSKFIYVGSRSNKVRMYPWLENLTKMRQCDIIIETCNPIIKSKTFGEWGNTAIEAAALGKIVITNSLRKDVYEKEYGDIALNIANNPEEIEKILKVLLSKSTYELLEMKTRTREWVVKNHSIKATAKRLWDKVYSNFFKE